MSNPSDLAALTTELADLRQQVDAQAAELAQLKAAPAIEERRVTRRHLLTGLAGLGAAGVAGVASAAPAAAADGDPLVLGEENDAATTTRLSGSGDDGPTLELRSGAGVHSTLLVDASPDHGSFAISGRGGEVFGVHGLNASAAIPAVVGQNQAAGPGVGAISEGGGPQLYLGVEPGAAGPPAGGWEAGHIKLDSAGDLWVCVESGDPGTWTRLLREDTAPGRVVPIAPIRALDTRAPDGRASGAPAIPGQRAGALRGGQAITLDPAGIGPIPATATGLVGNATVITPTGIGFLRILPAGATVPASSFDFTAGRNVSNGFTTGLTANGLTANAPTAATTRYHLVLDIAAYIT